MSPAMAMHIAKPTVIEAAGNKPKLIEEFVGRVNSGTADASIARMRISARPQSVVLPSISAPPVDVAGQRNSDRLLSALY